MGQRGNVITVRYITHHTKRKNADSARGIGEGSICEFPTYRKNISRSNDYN